MEALLKDQRYTYADYCTWDDSERWELIDGIPYAMSSPTWEHQGVSSELSRQIGNFLRDKPCKVFAAPFDVRLNADTYDDTVVQPDIVVICDRSKLSGTGCVGAPEMVIEILSPSTARRDKLVKFQQYRKAGVREYWIVDSDSKTVAAHILENDEYITRAYGETDNAPVHILEGCTIELSYVFAE
jgi:Uma2 family endonuclease